jgi:hypothetical protein
VCYQRTGNKGKNQLWWTIGNGGWEVVDYRRRQQQAGADKRQHTSKKKVEGNNQLGRNYQAADERW